jgi:hypothetical protein
MNATKILTLLTNNPREKYMKKILAFSFLILTMQYIQGNENDTDWQSSRCRRVVNTAAFCSMIWSLAKEPCNMFANLLVHQNIIASSSGPCLSACYPCASATCCIGAVLVQLKEHEPLFIAPQEQN